MFCIILALALVSGCALCCNANDVNLKPNDRFVYHINDEKFPHIRIRGDIKSKAHSPLLRELQSELEIGYSKIQSTISEPSVCTFEINRFGQVCNIEPNANAATEANNQAAQLVRKLSPLSGECVNRSKTSIQLEVRRDICFLRELSQ